MHIKKILILVLIALFTMGIDGIEEGEPDSLTSIAAPLAPDCTQIEEFVPEILIGGNVTISVGDNWYDVYIDQDRTSNLLLIEGEGLFDGKLYLEGCFINESEFHLFGSVDGIDAVWVGFAIEPEYTDPTFGGISFAWSDGYDPETEPDKKGFFYFAY